MGPLYEAIEGHVFLSGYAPDGDSVRFMPRDPRRLARLRRSSLIRTSPRNGSVQIRLEGIDAPELHYAAAAQPRGTSARDALLAWLGVSGARYMADGTTLSAYSPAALPVTMLANAVDPHGRPIAYLLREPMPPGTRRRRMSTAVLRATANHALLTAGHAYFLAYTSLPYAHRLELRDVARRARAARKGVWKHDASTRGFTLHSARSVGTGGVLIFPKLFRRCIDYLARREALGFSGSIVDWLAGHGSNASTTPDRVVVRHAANIAFASLVHERRDRISIATDINDLVFVEK